MAEHCRRCAARDINAPDKVLHGAAGEHRGDQPQIKLFAAIHGTGHQKQSDHRLDKQQCAASLLIPDRHIGHYLLPPLYCARAIRNSFRLLLLMGRLWPCTMTVFPLTARTYLRFTRKDTLHRTK